MADPTPPAAGSPHLASSASSPHLGADSAAGAPDSLQSLEDIILLEKYKGTQQICDDVSHLRKSLKGLLKDLHGMHSHALSFYASALHFSEQLSKFSFRRDVDDGDVIVTICGEQYLKLAQIQMSLAHQMNDVLIKPLERAVKDELKDETVTQKMKAVNSARDNYNNLHRKLKTAENDNKKSKTKVNPVKLAQDVENGRKEFETKNTDLQAKLRDMHTICRFDFMQRLAAFMYANKSYYQQGFNTIDEVGDDLLGVMKDMEDAKREYLANKNKEDHRITIFVNQTQSSGLHKQGYLYKHSNNVVKRNIKNWSMRWFQLRDGGLYWFNNWKDTEPSGSVNLVICRLKPVFDKPLCFEVLQADPEVRVVVRALTDKDFKEWIDAINNAIAYALTKGPEDPEAEIAAVTKKASNAGLDMSYYASADDGTVKKLRANKANESCADCGAPMPEWASINLGACICIDCSGIHRSLGTHISKVRSLTMDSLKPDMVRIMIVMGNDNVNNIWEANLAGEDSKPGPKADRASREKYINAKYKEKKYLIQPKSHKRVQREFVTQLTGDGECDLVRVSKYLAQGALLTHVDEDGVPLLHKVVQRNKTVPLQFLLLNGAKLDAVDNNGQTPIHYAAKFGLPDALNILLSLPTADMTVKDKEGNTALDLVKKADPVTEGHKKVQTLLETTTVAKEEIGISPTLAAKLATNNSFSAATVAKEAAAKEEDKKTKQRSSTISGRTKESKPSAMSLFKRGSVKPDKKDKQKQQDVEITAPTTYTTSPLGRGRSGSRAGLKRSETTSNTSSTPPSPRLGLTSSRDDSALPDTVTPRNLDPLASPSKTEGSTDEASASAAPRPKDASAPVVNGGETKDGSNGTTAPTPTLPIVATATAAMGAQVGGDPPTSPRREAPAVPARRRPPPPPKFNSTSDLPAHNSANSKRPPSDTDPADAVTTNSSPTREKRRSARDLISIFNSIVTPSSKSEEKEKPTTSGSSSRSKIFTRRNTTATAASTPK